MIVKSIKFSRNILFIFIFVYFSQGVLYPQGSIIAKSVLFGILTISLLFLFKLLLYKHNYPKIFWIWTIFVFLNIIGFILAYNYYDPKFSGMIRSILITLMPFYPFYYFSLKGEIKSYHFTRFFLTMLPIIIAQFFVSESQLLIKSNRSEVVNNSAYMFVYYLPFIFLFKNNKWIGILSLFILLFFIIESAKRSALITGLIIVLIFVYFHFRALTKQQRIYGFIVILLLSVGLFYYLYNVIINNEFLLDRMGAMLDGHSSGRDVILTKLSEAWLNSNNLLNLIFGFGFASSITISGGLLAHNDWMELLINFGLFGLGIFLVLFYLVSRYMFNYKEWKQDKRILMIALVVILLLMGLTSRWYSSMNGYTISIIFAFLIGDKNRMLS